MKLDLKSIRQEYKKGELTGGSIPKNPFILFNQWLEEAIRKGLVEPTAMLVSTVSAEGAPSSRTVLLKGIKENKLLFYTSYDSRKGRQLKDNPKIALTFVWPEFERQVHFEGVAHKLSTEESDAYFATRPHKSQIGARVSHQSLPIENRLELMQAFIKESARWIDKEVERPTNWGGYAVSPQRIEFWQGRPNRLHDRFLYKLTETGDWSIERLSP